MPAKLKEHAPELGSFATCLTVFVWGLSEMNSGEPYLGAIAWVGSAVLLVVSAALAFDRSRRSVIGVGAVMVLAALYWSVRTAERRTLDRVIGQERIQVLPRQPLVTDVRFGFDIGGSQPVRSADVTCRLLNVRVNGIAYEDVDLIVPTEYVEHLTRYQCQRFGGGTMSHAEVAFSFTFDVPEDTHRYRITNKFKIEPDIKGGKTIRVRLSQVGESQRCVVAAGWSFWRMFTQCPSDSSSLNKRRSSASGQALP